MTDRFTIGIVDSEFPTQGVCSWGTLIRAVSLAMWLIVSGAPIALAADPEFPVNTVEVETRCVVLEIYTQSRNEAASATADSIQKIVRDVPGIRLRVYDLDQQPQAAERLARISKAYRLTRVDLPLVYGLNQTVSGVGSSEEWTRRIRNFLRIEIFTRVGCPRCDAAKRYLPTLRAKYPGLHFDTFDIVSEPQANQRFLQLAREQEIGGVSVPGFWLCHQLIIGFDNETITGKRLETLLDRWTYPCAALGRKTGLIDPFSNPPAIGRPFSPLAISSAVLVQLPQVGAPPKTPLTTPLSEEAAPSLPIDGDQAVPELDIEPGTGSESNLPIDVAGGNSESDEQAIEVPHLGRLSVNKLGMPLFTFLIGLVDGFNPCAMWVLLFLLSVLVNLKDRAKILAVAGTFVIISGAAYFAFMAAWLNVLLLVGFLRWVQVLLALLALCVGTIHVKDFFAFKQGISLSIPESTKPGIYSRVRGIVMAEHLYAAIGGAMVLAVLVNMIELLCTAGLPALYSQILMLQNYPPWENYAYLFLYIIAYMLDDTLMVAMVVITLGKRKLQEHEGRWLKLVSGLVILALGLVLLFKPDWLG